MTTTNQLPTTLNLQQAPPAKETEQATPDNDTQGVPVAQAQSPRDLGYDYTPLAGSADFVPEVNQDWTIGAYAGGKQYKRLICQTPTNYIRSESQYDSGINGAGETVFSSPNGEHRRSDSSFNGPRRNLKFGTPCKPNATSTPVRGEDPNQTRTKKGRNKSKNARKNARKQSEAKRQTQPQSSDEEEHEQAEFEVFIAVEEKRTAELIGKQGTHIKRYWNELEADVTIIPGIEWDAKVQSEVKMKRDKETGKINQHVFRIEAYTTQAIVAVIQDMKERFWKFAHNFVTPAGDISEEFFADYFHDGTYYAKSHFLQPKPGSKKKYNQKHTVPSDADGAWTNDKFTEEESISRMMESGNPYEDAMPNSNSQRKKTKKGKTGKKGTWRPNMYCKCSTVKLDKRMETPIVISSIMDARRVWIQQPTHPSFYALNALETNIWHMYNKYGQYYMGERHPGTISRRCEIGNTWCIVPDPYYPSQKYVRAKVEAYHVDNDIVTVSFCDYGGFHQYPRCEVFNVKAGAKLLELPFQASLVQMIDLTEEDAIAFSPEDDSDIQAAINLLTNTTTKSAGEMTSTSASSYGKTSGCSDSRLRSSTILNNGDAADPPAPLTSVRTEKIKYNPHCPKTLSPDEPAEVHTDLSRYYADGSLHCEVVKDVEDLVNGTVTQHIRLFRYDFATAQKIYIDFRPEESQIQHMPTLDETSFELHTPLETSLLHDQSSLLNVSLPLDMNMPVESVLSMDPESMTKFLESCPPEMIQAALGQMNLDSSAATESPASPGFEVGPADLPPPVFVNESHGLLEEKSSQLNVSAPAFVPRF